jgi:nucleotide-binding universal stress UspA family protein
MSETTIKVAADGSLGSQRALEWALEEASLRGCGVELVGVYPSSTDPAKTVDSKAAAEEAIHATMDDTVAGRADIPLVSWHVVAGEPGDVLTRESDNSALLVLGSHGVFGLRHSAQNSVTDLVSRTAACPVVVVPPARSARSKSHALEIGSTP